MWKLIRFYVEILTIQLSMRERFQISISITLTYRLIGFLYFFYSRSVLNFAHTEELENVSSGDKISRGKQKEKIGEREIA